MAISDLTVSVLDYGAKGDGVTDDTLAIQDAIDALAALLGTSNQITGPVGTVHIPASLTPYLVSAPLWVDHDNIEVRGDGWGSFLYLTRPQSGLVFGVKRGALTVVDGSITGRHALAFAGGDYLQIQGGPLSAGSWGPQLTIECCVTPPTTPSTALFGVGVQASQPSPWVISTWNDPTQLLLTWKTTDQDPLQDTGCWAFGIQLPATPPPYRIVVQLDLTACRFLAFVNSFPVALLPANLPTATGLQFRYNEYYPFMVATQGERASGTSPLTLAGLRVSRSLRYTADGARLDGTIISDQTTYFTSDADTIGLLPLTDQSGTCCTVQHGDGSLGSGFILNAASAPSFVNNAVHDLSIQGSGDWGQTICVGNVLQFAATGVKALGGWQGIGSLNLGANYNILVERCFLAGADAAYYGFMQLLVARDIYCYNSGRATLRFLGCNARLEGLFIAFPSPNAECFFKAHDYYYGGNYAITNLVADFEGPTLQLAALYCEAHSTPPATSLVLQDIIIGTVGGGAALIMLKDVRPNYHPSYLRADNVQSLAGDYRVVLDIDGPGWHGLLTGVALTGPPIHHRARWGTGTSLVIEDRLLNAPPRQFAWRAGAHALMVQAPAHGQYTQWRCLATGDYGTPTPPLWAGLAPLGDGLAASIFEHVYITAALT